MKIAGVIATLDEAQQIAEAVESASAAAGAGARIVSEVVVVDGGSRDETILRAREAGARVIECRPGRGHQLQRGVEESTGDPVLFLHADTRLAAGWQGRVMDALADPSVAGGAFRLRFRENGVLLRVYELGVRLRVALFALPYGDQAIFVRRRVLDAVGGVPDVPVMEDLDLVKAMKRHGRVAALALPVTTSARRYLEAGPLRTMALHLAAACAWSFGLDRQRVASWLREAARVRVKG